MKSCSGWWILRLKKRKKVKTKCKVYWFGSMNVKETKDLHEIINLARNVRMTKQCFKEKKPRQRETWKIAAQKNHKKIIGIKANTQQTKIKASKRTLDATKHWNIIIKIIHARKPQEVSTKHKQAWINYPQWKKKIQKNCFNDVFFWKWQIYTYKK